MLARGARLFARERAAQIDRRYYALKGRRDLAVNIDGLASLLPREFG